MKKYKVYGIGTAIIDLTYHIQNIFFEKLALQRGSMTLIDKKQASILKKKLISSIHDSKTSHSIETHAKTTDHLKTNILKKTTCGGSAANTISAIQHLGETTYFTCKIGTDDNGRFFYREMSNAGITMSTPTDTDITGEAIIIVTPDAERTIGTCIGTGSLLSPDDLDKEALSQSDIVFLEGYLVTAPFPYKTALEAVRQAKVAGVKIALSICDPNVVRCHKENLINIIQKNIDILFCNTCEAKLLTGLNSIEDAVHQLKSMCRLIVITAGSQGTYIWDGKQLLTILAHPITVVDTNGAGDLFAGAFLYGIISGCNVRDSGEFASFAASILVTKSGARLSAKDYRLLTVHKPKSTYDDRIHYDKKT